MSNSRDPGGKQRIAFSTQPTGIRQWNRFPEQTSSSLTLIANETYYFEALQKDGTGADHIALGWQRPGTSLIESIRSEFVSPWLPEVSIFAEQSVTAEDSRQPARFRVIRKGSNNVNPMTVWLGVRGSATPATDYNRLPNTVTIPAGQDSVFVDVVPRIDRLTEGNETVVVEVRDFPGYRVGTTSDRTATATINDDAPSPGGGLIYATGNSLAAFSSFGEGLELRSFELPVFRTVIEAKVTRDLPNASDVQLRLSNTIPIVKGDLMLAEFYVRSLEPSARATLNFERNDSSFTKSLEREIAASSGWSKIQIPFEAVESYARRAAVFSLHLGGGTKTLQFAAFNLRNYGRSANLAPTDNTFLNNIGGNFGTMERIPVIGQSFKNAFEIRTVTPPVGGNNWQLQLYKASEARVEAGDEVEVTFWARAVTASARVDFALQESFGSYRTFEYRPLQPPTTWTLYSVRTRLTRGYNPGELQITWNVGFNPQTIQVSAFTWRNLNRTVELSSIPSRKPSVTYGGQQGNDSWRSEAELRIDQNRAANLKVEVRDALGTPVNGALVSIQQTAHRFLFGTAVNGYQNLLSPDGTAEAQRYQSEIKRLFNTVVIENNLKWPNFQADRQLAIAAADWAIDNKLTLRGHNVLWPSRTWMPSATWAEYDRILAANGLEPAKAFLRSEVNARIIDAATTFAGKASDWDVVNEPFANRDVIDILGDEEVLEWYRLFRSVDPNAKRTLNDYGIFSKNGLNTAHRADFDKWLSLLSNQGLVEQIGEQSHYNEGNLTDIATLGNLIQTYNNRFGLPVSITEFDFNTRAEQLQADYLRDYLTMAFSQPAVNQFLQWGFWSGSHWIPDAALYNRDFTPKLNGKAYEDLVFGDWWTHTRGTTRAGSFETRAFLGEYRIVVTVNGSEVVTTASLDQSGLVVQINLPPALSSPVQSRQASPVSPIESFKSLSPTPTAVAGQGVSSRQLVGEEQPRLALSAGIATNASTSLSVPRTLVPTKGLPIGPRWSPQPVQSGEMVIADGDSLAQAVDVYFKNF